MSIFDIVGVFIGGRWLEHTAEASHLLVNLLCALDLSAHGALALDRAKYLAVREIPDATVATFSGRYHPSLRGVETPRGQLWLRLTRCLIPTHQFAVLNVPHGDVTAIVTRDNRLELGIKEGERDRKLVGRLNFLLRLKHPEVDLPAPENYIISPLVEVQGREDVIRPVAQFVSDRLDAEVVVQVPDLDHLVGPQRDQVVTLLVQGEVLDSSRMPGQVGLRHQGKRIPEDDLTLLSARSDDLMLGRVDEGVNTLLMQVEGATFFVGEGADVMDVDAAV